MVTDTRRTSHPRNSNTQSPHPAKQLIVSKTERNLDENFETQLDRKVRELKSELSERNSAVIAL
jgi:hypothetical protein